MTSTLQLPANRLSCTPIAALPTAPLDTCSLAPAPARACVHPVASFQPRPPTPGAARTAAPPRICTPHRSASASPGSSRRSATPCTAPTPAATCPAPAGWPPSAPAASSSGSGKLTTRFLRKGAPALLAAAATARRRLARCHTPRKITGERKLSKVAAHMLTV